jgi:hypothetical protein
MDRFSVVVLVCSTLTDGADCVADTALDVIRGPKVASSLTCGLHAQALVAGLARPLGPDEYMKILCTREPLRLADGQAEPRDE